MATMAMTGVWSNGFQHSGKHYTQKRGRSVRQRTLTKGQSAPRDGRGILYGRGDATEAVVFVACGFGPRRP